uniref:Chlorophyll a-b binding proteinic n=1 Tax=Rhizophora mucronata TaxID=61149 RepID=A0A2P2L096_RHIMU
MLRVQHDFDCNVVYIPKYQPKNLDIHIVSQVN